MNRRIWAVVFSASLVATLLMSACTKQPDNNQTASAGGPGVQNSAAPPAEGNGRGGKGRSGSEPAPALPGLDKWRGKRNPVDANQASKEDIAKVVAVYATNCEGCHGKEGKGDGPQASTSKPAPGDFKAGFKYGGRDWKVMRSIMEGVPETSMTGFQGKLSEQEGWSLVHYVKHLAFGDQGGRHRKGGGRRHGGGRGPGGPDKGGPDQGGPDKGGPDKSGPDQGGPGGQQPPDEQ